MWGGIRGMARAVGPLGWLFLILTALIVGAYIALMDVLVGAL